MKSSFESRECGAQTKMVEFRGLDAQGLSRTLTHYIKCDLQAGHDPIFHEAHNADGSIMQWPAS